MHTLVLTSFFGLKKTTLLFLHKATHVAITEIKVFSQSYLFARLSENKAGRNTQHLNVGF